MSYLIFPGDMKGNTNYFIPLKNFKWEILQHSRLQIVYFLIFHALFSTKNW